MVSVFKTLKPVIIVEKEVEECMKYIIYRVQARERSRKYCESDKGKKKNKEYNKSKKKKEYDKKYRQSDKGKKKRKVQEKKYLQSDKGVITQRKKNKKSYDKDMGTVKGKRRRDIYRMHSAIKKRCKNNGGSIGKTKYHIEGYGWVYPPINGRRNWRWDGVTRKN
jgi:hypothetical protein